MVLGLFKKRDPIRGMKQEKGKGFIDDKTGNWFCCQHCKDEFDKMVKVQEKKMQKSKRSCCH